MDQHFRGFRGFGIFCGRMQIRALSILCFRYEGGQCAAFFFFFFAVKFS